MLIKTTSTWYNPTNNVLLSLYGAESELSSWERREWKLRELWESERVAKHFHVVLRRETIKGNRNDSLQWLDCKRKIHFS
jgi:hypothetical protein